MYRLNLVVALSFFISIVLIDGHLYAQNTDSRAQFPKLLANSYFNACPGYMQYPYTNDHVQPGHSIDEIKIHHGAARVIIGHEFSKYFSAQLSVMRPVKWVEFKGWDGTGEGRATAWINSWTISGKPEYPISDKLSVYGEFGVASLSRRGFSFRGTPVITSENYIGWMAGAGMQYAISNKWDLNLNYTYLPPNKSATQPYTYLASLGIKYNLRPLPEEKVARNSSGEYIFPKHQIQIGYANDFIGYRVNSWFVWTEQSKLGIPIFWEGDVLTRGGFAINYQRNVFHTKKSFSLDWGSSFSFWKSQQSSANIIAISVFPVLRFWLFRRDILDFYFDYSAVGPSFITPVLIDGYDTGEHFTFQDFMGIGFYWGKEKRINTEFKITHYSNGGAFSINPGVDVPLMFNIGYTFR